MQPSQRAVTATASEINSRTFGSSLPIFAAPSAFVLYARTRSGDAWPICWIVAINCFRYSSHSIIMAAVLQFQSRYATNPRVHLRRTAKQLPDHVQSCFAALLAILCWLPRSVPSLDTCCSASGQPVRLQLRRNGAQGRNRTTDTGIFSPFWTL